jgi:vacuolar-type H+-ATPase subunit E/Vma4
VRTLGSVASVAAAIADDVELEREAVRRRAEASRAAVTAGEAAEPAVPPEREARLVSARQAARERLARADWEAAREALEDREAWMAAVAEEGLRRLRAPGSDHERRRGEIRALVREALEVLPGAAFDVAVSAEDAALFGADEARVAGLAPGVSLRVTADEGVSGGCRVQARDARASFDNTYPARARRLEPEWRAAVGEAYGP